MPASLIRGLVVAIVFAAAAALVPRLTSRRGFWLAALLAAAYYFQSAFTGFLIVSVLAYSVARCLGYLEPRMRWRWSVLVLIVGVVLFLAARLGAWDERPLLSVAGWPMFLSLDMWLALRLVTFLWETGAGVHAVPPLSTYLSWVALPVTLAGPLVRPSEWSAGRDERRVWATTSWWIGLFSAAAKLAAGLLLTVAPSVLEPAWPNARLLRGSLNVFLWGPLGFYLTVAGYYHMMQALGRPAGVAIPDSFRRPFGRENISAFWANWNMTATRVFRDYLFYARWGTKYHYPYPNTIVLFALVGLWHDANAYWLLWGILHGVLFCSFLVWRRWKPQILRFVPLHGTPVAQMTARVITYASVCLCWYLAGKILQWLGDA